MHIVRTEHIQRLIRNGLELSERAHNVNTIDGTDVNLGNPNPHRNLGSKVTVPVDHVLAKAAADLRHAAEELEAERLSVLGWKQA